MKFAQSGQENFLTSLSVIDLKADVTLLHTSGSLDLRPYCYCILSTIYCILILDIGLFSPTE